MTRIPSGPRAELLAAGVLVTATSVLVAQFLTATPVVATVGDRSVRLGTLGWRFTLRDAAVIAVTASAAGVSATALLTSLDPTAATDGPSEDGDPSPENSSDELLEARRQEWEHVSERLANNEESVYRTVLDADGVLPQSEIVAQTDLSKATVSRTLDSLEARDLVERKRRGMGNTVMLT